ncbi:hypothetical protein [Nostoc sp. ChiQUE01b]|uniref:hypothetical protein n=1 Tax=Nostoc sp. ChiQUE01b TaxID=3075376 RepID=UPI002AD40411|nr:hypothetical protein [Nostoc sp. ChiQUE01b]MDZ8257827.1 hypothetical protein [Nostoc sp. ChiQUE01b]
MSNLALQGSSVSPVATREVYVTVIDKVLDRILEEMEKPGWEWDGTLWSMIFTVRLKSRSGGI